MIVATGHSQDLDSSDAIEEALDACAETLGGVVPQAALLYAGIDHDHAVLLEGVEARYPGIQLVGGTTHGELSTTGFAEDSVVLMLVHSERVGFGAGVGEGLSTDPEGAARRAVAEARNGLTKPVRLGIMVPEGLGVEMQVVTDTISEELGSGVTVCGGRAGDQVQFKQTYQFCNGRVYSDAVAVLLLAGPLRVSTGVDSGWVPMGEDHWLTKVDGQVIYEIDGEPALDLWSRYFGSFDQRGSRNTFCVYPDSDQEKQSQEYFLGAPSHFQEDGSMVSLNPIVPGARIRFADATRDQILAGASTSAKRAQTTFAGRPEAAFVFSCANRHAILGTRVRDEIGLLQERIGVDVPMIGFYTYGEICPLPGSSTTYTHGGTFVTVLIGEET